MKHEEDDEEQDIVEIEVKKRCCCCKETDHVVEDCPRDPNIKTNKCIDSEYKRVSKTTENKILFSETNVQTA